MPDKWLNSTQGVNAKRKIQETLAARIASGELSGRSLLGEGVEGQEDNEDGAWQDPEKERQAS